VTRYLVAFEGSPLAAAEIPVAWGAAAILDGDTLVNSTTGQRSHASRLAALAEAGHLVRLQEPIAIRKGQADPVVVLVVDTAHPLAWYLRASSKKVPGIIASAMFGDIAVSGFASRELFNDFRKSTVDRIAKGILYEEVSADLLPLALKAGLVLGARDPMLNAIRVQYSDVNTRDRAERLTRASLNDEDLVRKFDEIREAMSAKASFGIDYEQGVAKGGGLDVDNAVKILTATKNAHDQLQEVVVLRYRALNRPPPPRLNDLEAASAHLTFTSVLDDEAKQSLGDRVARYLELKLLEESLNGNPPVELEDQVPLEKALLKLQDFEGTEVLQRKIAGGPRIPLNTLIGKAHSDALPEQSFILLGFKSGLVGLGERAELTLSLTPHSSTASMLISTRNNGSGEEPFGARPLREDRSTQFEPAWFSVLAQREKSRDRFHLRQAELLSPGRSFEATAIPSTVVVGAFVTDLKIPVERRSEGELYVDGQMINLDVDDEPSLSSAKGWLRRYEKRCREIELSMIAQRRSFRYRLPTKILPPGNLELIAIVLNDLGGVATQDDVATHLRGYQGLRGWKVNVAGEVAEEQDLVEPPVGEAGELRLTENGRAFVALYGVVRKMLVDRVTDGSSFAST